MNDPLADLAAIAGDGWLVGGALRDRLLGRPSADYDIALATEDPAEVQRAARGLARTAGGVAFALSEAFGAWRVVAHDRRWQVDLMALAGGSIQADLSRRDLTVNAIAAPLRDPLELVDPYGGLADLGARRLRVVSGHAFVADPLRALRVCRLSCELDFAVEAETMRLARISAVRVSEAAPERVFSELRGLICADRALDGLAMMEATGVTAAVLPELTALGGIEQSRYHHLDVLDHTRAVLAETIALERDPVSVFGDCAPALTAFMARPLANELTRSQALRFGALLHDIGKPQTRSQTADGRITFLHHDETGAGVAAEILTRLRASERLIGHVAALTRHHLRLGFLVHRMPLDRHEVYRYLRACEGVPVDVTVLSVADRLATRGDNADRAISRHIELARGLVPEALRWMQRPPRPPVRGDELCAALGIAPGPRLGELLGVLEEAAYAGEVGSAEEAIGYARTLVGQDG